MLRETLGHTGMLKWTGIGAAHWFVNPAPLFGFAPAAAVAPDSRPR